MERTGRSSAAQAITFEPSPWSDDFSAGYHHHTVVRRPAARRATSFSDDNISLSRRTMQAASSMSSSRSAHVVPGGDDRFRYNNSSTHRNGRLAGSVTRPPRASDNGFFQHYGTNVHNAHHEPRAVFFPPLWRSDDMLYSHTQPSNGRRHSRMPDDDLYVACWHRLHVD